MIHYLLAFGWGLVLFAAFIGWGSFLGRRLLRLPGFGTGESACAGIALTIAVGGVLNLFALISPSLVFGYVGLGVALGAVEIAQTARGRFPGWKLATHWSIAMRAGVGFLVVIALIRYAGSVQPTSMNRHDDLTGYVIFPVRMLQTGEIGADPFNGRRMESGLGGMSFLHALMFVAFPEQHAPLVDLGVGLLAALLMAIDLGRARGLNGPRLLALAAVVLFDQTQNVNITAVLTAVALLIALARAIGREGSLTSRAVLISLLASGLCAIKSNYIPVTVFVLAIYYGLNLARRRTLVEGVAVLLLSIVWLAPWMESMRRSSGTWLYPVLGKGVHGSQYGTFVPPSAVLKGLNLLQNEYVGLVDALALTTWIASTGALIQAHRQRRLTAEVVAFPLATLMCAVVLLKMFEVVDAFRYLDPIYTAAIVVALTEILRPENVSAPGSDQTSERVLPLLFASFVVALTIGGGWSTTRVFFQICVRNTVQGMRGYSFTTQEEIARIQEMQASVPAGEPIVIWVTKPYLLDFKRNPIFILDWPGAASPQPGLPFFKGPEPVLAYFRTIHLRYFGLEPAIRDDYPKDEEAIELHPTWVKTVTRHGMDLFESLQALSKTQPHHFDAKDYVVIDLGQPARPADPQARPSP